MSRMCRTVAVVALMAFFLYTQLHFSAMAGCPLDLNGYNITLVASTCLNNVDHIKCCRYINAFLAVSNARYANATSSLGVDSSMSEVCFSDISKSLNLYGVAPNATSFCGLGKKITVNYECKGRTTVVQMLQSPGFNHVAGNCKVSLLEVSDCRRCINSTIMYLHGIVQAGDNVTLNICRDATFVALASQADNESAAEFASCFFGVPGLSIAASWPYSSSLSPKNSPSPLLSDSPSGLPLNTPLSRPKRHCYHLTIIPGVATAVTVVAVVLLVVLLVLIRRKSRELEDSENTIKPSMGAFPSTRSSRKIPQGSFPMLRKFSFKETKKATNNFSTVIGHGEFGTMYKAQFSDGLVGAVKRMEKISEQAAENKFSMEIELLGRLHHRHLVALRGFSIEKHERFLVYEYMENGSLKDHLHSRERSLLSWQMRIQIAIDIAKALEYLHFYCDPPLCHGDIESSNILLDKNFVAKVAGFGLTRASKDGSICIEPISSNEVKATPGYVDLEYMLACQLTEKSDIYSYGLVLLELVTARRDVLDRKNMVKWSQVLVGCDSRLPELVDPRLGEAFDYDQLQTIMTIMRWCTEEEARARPSIKQVLRLLCESLDPFYGGFNHAVETEEEHEGIQGLRRTSKEKLNSSEVMFLSDSGDGKYLASSSSTNKSSGSRTFLLENGSPISA
ncbi:hypothetical protein Dimus_002548 [Dionaea muscipula]